MIGLNHEKMLKESPLPLAKEEGVSGVRSCHRNGAQPTVRLTSVSVMSKADQQRLGLLLDELIERRIKHLLQGEGS